MKINFLLKENAIKKINGRNSNSNRLKLEKINEFKINGIKTSNNKSYNKDSKSLSIRSER